jgi:hypothetical protein
VHLTLFDPSRNCEVSPIIDLPDPSPAGLGPPTLYTPRLVWRFVFDKVSITISVSYRLFLVYLHEVYS